MPPPGSRSSTLRCTVLGTAFGLVFPVVATALAAYEAGGLHLAVEVQRSSPLLWIIDSAPFWLGLLAHVVGRRQDMLSATLATVREQAELLRVRAEEAESASRAKSAFLANMSHEIRTPLTSIIGFAEVLSGDAAEPHRQSALYIQRSGLRLLETLDSVLDLARMEAEQLPVSPEPVSLAEEVEAVAELLRPSADQKGLALRTDVAPGAAAYVDRRCLHRMLVNLCGNAVKFTDAGGVSLRAGAAGGRAWLSVEDTGRGIAPAFLPHLFDAFAQETTGHGRRFEGSGLGLALVDRMARLHGGRVEVQTRLGAGTTFTVWLPGAEREAAVPEASPRLRRAA